MNVKRILAIILVLGIIFLNGCKDKSEAEVETTTKKAVTTTTTTAAVEKETTTEPETTTVAGTTKAAEATTRTVITTTMAPETTTAAPESNGGATTEAKYLSIEEEMLAKVNAERAKVGKNALTLNGTLCYCAQVRAAELVESFSHYRPDGTACFTVLNESNISYSAAGENIAWNQSSVSEVMEDWMNSPGHKANILSEDYDYNQLGCACFYANGSYYWVQLFIYA